MCGGESRLQFAVGTRSRPPPPVTPGSVPAPAPLQQPTARRTRLAVSECTGSLERLSHGGSAQTDVRVFSFPLVPEPSDRRRCHPGRIAANERPIRVGDHVLPLDDPDHVDKSESGGCTSETRVTQITVPPRRLGAPSDVKPATVCLFMQPPG